MSIIIAVLVFSIIVFIHELGHFLVAVKSGMSVEEFSIGIGPRIYTRKGKLTNYSIKLLPFGGSCALKGDDFDDDTSSKTIDESEGSFNSAPVGCRIATIAAGPLANIILAFLAAIVIVCASGEDMALVESTLDGYPASEVGIEAGDKIVKIDNKRIAVYRDMQLYLFINQGKTVDVTVERTSGDKKENFTYTITPKKEVSDDGAVKYMLGLSMDTSNKKISGIGNILYYSYHEIKYIFDSTIYSIKYIFSGKANMDDVSGAVGIVAVTSETVDASMKYGFLTTLLTTLNLTILFSASIGIMNLIPFPALDGGRLVFLIIEAVRRKPVSRKVEAVVHTIGFALLMALMTILLFHDIDKLIVG